MWWSAVVQMDRQESREHTVKHGIKLGSFDGGVLGEKQAKKAAKALGRSYIRNRGPGQPRIVESPLILEGCMDMTTTSSY
jgi:hypothetical protein